MENKNKGTCEWNTITKCFRMDQTQKKDWDDGLCHKRAQKLSKLSIDSKLHYLLDLLVWEMEGHSFLYYCQKVGSQYDAKTMHCMIASPHVHPCHITTWCWNRLGTSLCLVEPVISMCPTLNVTQCKFWVQYCEPALTLNRMSMHVCNYRNTHL